MNNNQQEQDRVRCSQCLQEMNECHLYTEHGVDTVYAYVCTAPACPNYNLLQAHNKNPQS